MEQLEIRETVSAMKILSRLWAEIKLK